MKKFTILSLLIGFSAIVFGQSPLILPSDVLVKENPEVKTFNFYRPTSSSMKKNGPQNMVYNYSTALTDFHGQDNVASLATLLWPDTAISIVARSRDNTQDSVYTIDQYSGRFNNNSTLWSHTVGFVFDPRSVIYGASQAGDYFKLSDHNTYRVDSISVPYFYMRNSDANVVDTLIIQYYNTFTYSSVSNSGGNPPDPNQFFMATTTYSHTQNLGSGAVNTIKIPLTEADTVSVGGGKFKTATVGLSVPAKRKFGFSMTYKSGAAYSQTVPFDTLGASSMETPGGTVDIHNRLNRFFYIFNFDQNRYFEEITTAPNADKIYNQGMFIPRFTRYNTSTNGWNGIFYPGQAIYTTTAAPPRRTPVFPEATFYVFSPNVGVNNVNALGYGLGEAYPNPASASDKVNVDFKLGNSENVTIGLYDVMGKLVKSIATENFAGGEHTVSFDLNNVKSGVYFYTITAGNFTASKKFTVVK